MSGRAPVPAEFVDAAVAAARDRGQDVADVPMTVIARYAGTSRSTLLRRLGGTRAVLDDAVRAAGVDPGGRRPVRERAIEAAARLVGERGLAGVTLDAVAVAAGCSVPSLHLVFEGRDGLLAAVFDRYGPALDLEAVSANPTDEVAVKIRGIYRALVTAFRREPRVLPALFADLLGRPDGPGNRILSANIPRMLASMGGILQAEVDAGRLRPLPLPLLIQLMVGPVVAHLLVRPVLDDVLGPNLPGIEESCDVFAEAFLRAVEKR